MDVSCGDEQKRDRKMLKKSREKELCCVLCGRLQPPNYRRLPWKEFASRGDLCLCQVDMKHAALDHRGPVCPSRRPTTWQPRREKEGRWRGDVGWELERRTPSLILTLISFTHLPWAALNSVYMYQSFINLILISSTTFFLSTPLYLHQRGANSNYWWHEKKNKTINPTLRSG